MGGSVARATKGKAGSGGDVQSDIAKNHALPLLAGGGSLASLARSGSGSGSTAEVQLPLDAGEGRR